MQEVQVACEVEQVWQGEVHATHRCNTDIVPTEQLLTQRLPSRLKLVQEVQLLTTIEQVAQSPVQAVATPEMLMYPKGMVI
jgi:hypothetical protein